MVGMGGDGNRRLVALVAGVVLVVVLAALAVLRIVPGGSGQTGASQEEPGEYSRVSTYEKQVSANQGFPYIETFATLRCDPGDQLLSGGFSAVDEGTVVIANAPDTASSAEAWLVGWENDASPDSVDVTILCAEAAFPPHEQVSGIVE